MNFLENKHRNKDLFNVTYAYTLQAGGPDMERFVAHEQAMLDMLDRNGHEDWPLYLNEGGNFMSMNLPLEGVSPYVVHSGNGWYIGPLSYHLGNAERIAAALSARMWLVGLKYQDRVTCVNDFFTPNRYMDVDFTPIAGDKIPNTLGRILGDASFVEDIRFAPFSRAYVFKDRPAGNSPLITIGSGGTIAQPERNDRSIDRALERIDHHRTKGHFSLCQQWSHPLEQVVMHIDGRADMLMHKI